MNKTLIIPRTLANRLLGLAQHTPDAEICGLVSTTADQQYRVYSIQNIASPADRVFEMEPKQQIDAFRKMRENGESLFAVFHSHPHGQATPSARDLQQATFQDALNIIISLGTAGVLDMRGYYYSNNAAQAVELIVE